MFVCALYIERIRDVYCIRTGLDVCVYYVLTGLDVGVFCVLTGLP